MKFPLVYWSDELRAALRMSLLLVVYTVLAKKNQCPERGEINIHHIDDYANLITEAYPLDVQVANFISRDL